MDEEEIKKILLIKGLKNAVEFHSSPNKKAVMGKLMSERKDLRVFTQSPPQTYSSTPLRLISEPQGVITGLRP